MGKTHGDRRNHIQEKDEEILNIKERKMHQQRQHEKKNIK